MYSLNRAQVLGNITRDPEMRQLPSGVSVATFSVATNRVWTDQQGVKQEKAEFHDVVAWRKLAEICGQYLTKGGKVYVEGRLETREWAGDDGVKRRKTEIVAENLIMLGSRGGAAAPRAAAGLGAVTTPVGDGVDLSASVNDLEGQQPPAAVVGKASASADVKEEVTIDDLPF